MSHMIFLFFVFQINFIVLLGGTRLAGTFDKMEETRFFRISWVDEMKNL